MRATEANAEGATFAGRAVPAVPDFVLKTFRDMQQQHPNPVEGGQSAAQRELRLHKHTVRREPTHLSMPCILQTQRAPKTGAFSSFAFSATSTYATHKSVKRGCSSGVLYLDRKAQATNLSSFAFTAPASSQPYTLIPTKPDQGVTTAQSQPSMRATLERVRGHTRVGRYIVTGHNHYQYAAQADKFQKKQADVSHSFGGAAWYPTDDIYRRARNCLVGTNPVGGLSPYMRGATTSDVKSALHY
jgi:hypothetical protein